MRKTTYKKGFTLIELMTSVTIFAIIMTISLGSILGIFDANRKTRSMKTVMNNLNLSIETMSKEMRYGKNYHCGSGNLTTPQNCAGGDTLMSFLSSEGNQITYSFSSSAITKQVDNNQAVPITAPEVVIDSLTFYTFGASVSDTLQPKVIIRIKGHAGTGKSRSDFTLETMASQRMIDI